MVNVSKEESTRKLLTIGKKDKKKDKRKRFFVYSCDMEERRRKASLFISINKTSFELSIILKRKRYEKSLFSP